MSDPNNQIRMALLDENDVPIRETLHVCRPAPEEESREFGVCLRGFAEKVETWLRSQDGFGNGDEEEDD